jgi:hypothetical protein
MLNLRLRVISVDQNQKDQEKVDVFAAIEISDEKLEKLRMLQKARMPQPNHMFKEISESVVVSMQQIMPLPCSHNPPTKPIETAVSFMLPKAEFNAMGRPTVGDYIVIGATTEKATDEPEPASLEIPISAAEENTSIPTQQEGKITEPLSMRDFWGSDSGNAMR